MLETWEKSYNFYGIKTYEAEGKHWDQTTPWTNFIRTEN
jgi:hypothetical protein